MRWGLLSLIAIIISSSIIISSCSKTQYDFDIASCETDDDCVREASCCDCSLGEYINKKYYKEVTCKEECDCEAELSIGMCLEGTCRAIPLDQEYCDDTHRLGETWMEGDKPCTCLLNNVIDCGTTEQKLNKREAEQEIKSYYETIDYSCSTNNDCIVKDVHNCCGYFPKCVNKNFETKPDSVTSWCKISEMNAVCGYPTINSCECQNGQCIGII